MGEWKDDKYDGQGVFTRPNGDKYEGQWKEGKRHGKGTCTYVDGTIESGFFVKDKFKGENK